MFGQSLKGMHYTYSITLGWIASHHFLNSDTDLNSRVNILPINIELSSKKFQF